MPPGSESWEPTTPEQRRAYEEECERQIGGIVRELVENGFLEAGRVARMGSHPDTTIEIVVRQLGSSSVQRHTYDVWGPLFRDEALGGMESPGLMAVYMTDWLIEPLPPGDELKGRVTELGDSYDFGPP
jgi:hypothetical protein